MIENKNALLSALCRLKPHLCTAFSKDPVRKCHVCSRANSTNARIEVKGGNVSPTISHRAEPHVNIES